MYHLSARRETRKTVVGWSPERLIREVDQCIRYQKAVFRTASDPVQSTETTSTMGDVQA